MTQPPASEPYQPPQGDQPAWSQPAYGAGQPAVPATQPDAPYGVDPTSGLPYSDKQRLVAGLLQVLLPFVGISGVGRLYTGHLAIGLVQLIGMLVGFVLFIVLIGFFIVPVIWLWSVIDGVMMLTGSVKDAQGRPLRP